MRRKSDDSIFFCPLGILSLAIALWLPRCALTQEIAPAVADRLQAAENVQAADIRVRLRSQVPRVAGEDRYLTVIDEQAWSSQRTALIICDVWDLHHGLNAVRRVGELAPRIDAFAKRMREKGVLVIHAPSDCMAAYQTHPSRERAERTHADQDPPDSIRSWCDFIDLERGLTYPVDQSDGGEDDDRNEHEQWHASLEMMGRNPKLPWSQQTPWIAIDPNRDFISESGTEIWHILKKHGIENVVVCGVHINMCVLGRPFGLRQLRAHGFRPVLVRDLTDTMYNPERWPYVNHFTGTDLVVDHIERSVCPTMTSDQVLGGTVFRFSADRRPHWIVMISEDEYETEKTLSEWARVHLARRCRVSFVWEHPLRNGYFPGLEDLDHADGLLMSVRRRPLDPHAMERVRLHWKRGKPILGLRTSSHAFSLRENGPSPGLEQWAEWDADAFGGNYSGHYPDGLLAQIDPVPGNREPIGDVNFESRGSLYRVLPLRAGTRVLWQGTLPDQPSQPVAWTFVRPDAGKSFYTSLGHKSDFEQPAFRAMLLRASYWLMGMEVEVTDESVDAERLAYHSGSGKQR
jgi:nicotinamidase-related amidase